MTLSDRVHTDKPVANLSPKKPRKSKGTPLQTFFPPALLPAGEHLYIGVDIGKETLHAGFISESLLKMNRNWQACPYLPFPRSRTGFDLFLATIQLYAPLSQCTVLYEQTGHYSMVVQDLLLEQNITAFRHHVKERPNRLIKNDKHDSLFLAAMIYNNCEKAIPTQEHKFVFVQPLPPLAAKLKPLAQRYHELSKESTRRLNQLTALADMLIPELTAIYKDPNSQSALALRLAFPTHKDIAKAKLDALCETRPWSYPRRQDLEELQTLVRDSIGIRDENLAASLVVEQKQLIAELALLEMHKAELDKALYTTLQGSREAQILMSFTGVKEATAATLISSYGSIDRFPTPGKLQSFWGWAPDQSQTGISFDTSKLPKRGGWLKSTLFMVTMNAVQHDEYWKARYQRLVTEKCAYDDKKKEYIGKMRFIARIAGDIIKCMHSLLRKDYDLLQSLGPDDEIPPPQLYDPKHKSKYAQLGIAPADGSADNLATT